MLRGALVQIASSSVRAMGMADARSVDSKHHGWSKVPGLAAVSKILESLDMAEGGFGRASVV